ncbi:MAG: DegT/DnrJ/EryC1/StrS family aminotransferase, partial [Candidatus Diapherotrites archaeon]|nr:DegT/DnrJ/EryC1/StrS family aminotransferase [Candidatus Diapherotrites archaeon]
MNAANPDFLPIADTHIVGNEQKYVREAIESGWISSKGPFVQRFENAFANYIGTGHAASCTNGTAAL